MQALCRSPLISWKKAFTGCSVMCDHASMVQSLIPRVCMQVSDKALAQADPKAALRAVMKSWLPLSEAVLGMAVEQLPDPASAAPERLPRLLALDALDALDSSLSASVQQVGVAGPCRLPWQQCVLQLKYQIPPASRFLDSVWEMAL